MIAARWNGLSGNWKSRYEAAHCGHFEQIDDAPTSED